MSKIERVVLAYPHITVGEVMSDFKFGEGYSNPKPGSIMVNIYPYWPDKMKIRENIYAKKQTQIKN